jgi:hypothetical protein
MGIDERRQLGEANAVKSGLRLLMRAADCSLKRSA